MHREANTSIHDLAADDLGQQHQIRVMDPYQVIWIADGHHRLEVQEVELLIGTPQFGLILLLESRDARKVVKQRSQDTLMELDEVIDLLLSTEDWDAVVPGHELPHFVLLVFLYEYAWPSYPLGPHHWVSLL